MKIQPRRIVSDDGTLTYAMINDEGAVVTHRQYLRASDIPAFCKALTYAASFPSEVRRFCPARLEWTNHGRAWVSGDYVIVDSKDTSSNPFALYGLDRRTGDMAHRWCRSLEAAQAEAQVHSERGT